ncbi:MULTISPECIES: DUF4265 domain-containing protein [unclassified Amycolatopsis]|uniref:DUF4265 domain-containing protein n=1 Tax=unclassified Amycolatopsis TaxID=2618356 RepID=UPI001EE794B5|nr:DUF4265 domain-containing protein [Amycolatopsis sp. Poz14]MCG3757584.1 DUF4265 domain-containing protein [Amycolatopsis sp. Poz14]
MPEQSADLDQPTHVKVVFELPSEGDDWPPVSREGLWAVPLGPDHVRLASIPWFARGAAEGDVFRVERDEEGVLRPVERVEWSGNCTIRMIVWADGPFGGDLGRAIDHFAPFGFEGEQFSQFGMVGFTVPPGANLAEAKRALQEGRADGSWAYEEGCVSDAWLAAGS